MHRGTLDNLESLRSGAASCDGVIYTAFVHDFSAYAEAGEIDRRAVEALSAALEGTGRPLVVTSGTALLAPGHLGTEDATADPTSAAAIRIASETMALGMASRGVRSSVVRLPLSVHGEGDCFVHALITIARDKGVSAYVGDGSNRWPTVHRLDAVRLFRMALEDAHGGTTLHAVAEEGVPLRDIAEISGTLLQDLKMYDPGNKDAAPQRRAT